MILRKTLTALLAAVAVISVLSGCSGEGSGSDNRVKVVCGLPPVAFIAHEIGGKYINPSAAQISLVYKAKTSSVKPRKTPRMLT